MNCFLYKHNLTTRSLACLVTFLDPFCRSTSTPERYACHLYTEVLRKLPAVVRRWWNATQSRQKNFIDNLTTNYVSSLICSEELKAIANRKEKHENMQVSGCVLSSLYSCSGVLSRREKTTVMLISSMIMTITRNISRGTISLLEVCFCYIFKFPLNKKTLDIL